MRLSEPITIYLAAGASFGVSRYQFAMVERRASRRRALAEGIAAAMLWPIAAAAILFNRLRHKDERGARHESHDGISARVEEARRALVNSINRMLEVVRNASLAKREEMELTLYTLRESAEQYAGLAMVKSEDVGAAPLKHEMELARISGRRGDELLIAARCAHRRNRARTVARFERERSRMLRALMLLRADEGNHQESYSDGAERVLRMQMSEARLQVYGRAFALFSLVGDKDAARSAANLLDAESARLQSLKNEDALGASDVGEERCIEQSPQLIYRDRPTETTFTRG